VHTEDRERDRERAQAEATGLAAATVAKWADGKESSEE